MYPLTAVKLYPFFFFFSLFLNCKYNKNYRKKTVHNKL